MAAFGSFPFVLFSSGTEMTSLAQISVNTAIFNINDRK
jgi:hypothetical protein